MNLNLFRRSVDLEQVCKNSESEKEIEKVFRKTYREVYLLTHPFYENYFYFLDNRSKETEKSFLLLSESIKKAGKKDEILAILTLQSSCKYMLDAITYDYLSKIYKIMTKYFKGRLYTRVQTGGFYDEQYHKLPIQFQEPLNGVKVTARGVYGERCVLSTLQGFSNVHNISEKNCLLDIDESVMRKRKKDYDYDSDLVLCPEGETGLISLEEINRRKEEWWCNHPFNRNKN